MAGLALFPLFNAYVHDRTESYTATQIMFAALAALVAAELHRATRERIPSPPDRRTARGLVLACGVGLVLAPLSPFWSVPLVALDPTSSGPRRRRSPHASFRRDPGAARLLPRPRGGG